MQIISGRNSYGEVSPKMKLIDFTNCRRIWGKAYNGANGKKIAVDYEGPNIRSEEGREKDSLLRFSHVRAV